MARYRDLRIHILNVGHGDTIILEIPIGKGTDYVYGIIDCMKFDKVVKPYLDNMGVGKLAFVAATHPHEDHISGIEKLLSAYEDNVGVYWESGAPYVSDTYLDLLKYMVSEKAKNLVVQRTSSGTIVRFDKTLLRVLSPPDELLKGRELATNINNASIVIRVEHGESKILLAGDAQFGNWAHMRLHQRNRLRAQALKVSHHGSMHGNFLEALEIVNPIYAIISAGTRNLKKFPHETTLKALKTVRKRVKIYNTRENGNVVITSNGTTRLSVSSAW